MIDNKNLRYRSPITGKAKSSMILEYSSAGLILEADEEDRGRLITAILESELYGMDDPPKVSHKALGAFYAITSDLEMKGGEWLMRCEINQKNSPSKK